MWLALPVLVLVGFSNTFYLMQVSTFLQQRVPDHLRGRVMSLYSTGAMTAAISGISIFGWVTERFGESTGVTGIGATFLLTASLGGWLSWSIRNR